MKCKLTVSNLTLHEVILHIFLPNLNLFKHKSEHTPIQFSLSSDNLK